MKTLTLYTDGGARGNPGPAAAGIALFDGDDKAIAKKSKYLGETTNNQAEYQALLLGLATAAKATNPSKAELRVFMDSELVVRQINGQYRVRDIDLQPLFAKAIKLLSEFASFEVVHIRREKNTVADGLVNFELDKQGF
jgi:ribonuclease HI